MPQDSQEELRLKSDRSWSHVWATERDYIPIYPVNIWGPWETRRLFKCEDQFWRHSLEPYDE